MIIVSLIDFGSIDNMILLGLLVACIVAFVVTQIAFIRERHTKNPTIIVTEAGAGADAPAPAKTAVASSAAAKKSWWSGKATMIGWILAGLLSLGIAFLIFSGMQNQESAEAGQEGGEAAQGSAWKALSNWGDNFWEWLVSLSLPMFLFIAIVLIILAFAVPKKAKPIVWTAMALFLLVGFTTSGIGSLVYKSINAFDTCVGYGDCSQRAGDYPIVNGGTVDYVMRGGVESFYVKGTVAIRNYEDYCLGISPWDAFYVDATSDNRIIFITARLEEPILATVTSKPAWKCEPVH